LDLEPSDPGAAWQNARPRVVLHSVTGPAGSALARWLEATFAPFGQLRPLVGPFPRPIVRLSGPDALLEDTARALPDGAARPEAIAVRLRRAGVELGWGAPDVLPDAAAFIRLCHSRGASAVELARADPSLLTELQLGAFFHAYWRRRVLRHVACRRPLTRALGRLHGVGIGLASDLAFWAGARSVASTAEWERLTRSSYVVFYYHRIGVGGWPGQEHLDLHSRRFERQLHLLRLLRFRALTPDELLAFHSDPRATLPRRSYVLAADDALRDAVSAFRRHADLHPQVFVNTSAVGGSPWWAFGQHVASWEELAAFAEAGGVVVSHCRGHPKLATLEANELQEELAGALEDLRGRLGDVPPLLAYPHGQHDQRVRETAAAAGYRAAFTTAPGRNGAGIDAFCLRRVAIKDWDGYGALLWKTVTGELLPRRWEELRGRLRAGRDGARDAD
jgi:peptidoglycan/xylan/chitin deacetylase (PgdA/CDA1 family)